MAIKLKKEFKISDKARLDVLDKIYDELEAQIKTDVKYKLYLCDEKENRTLAANRYYWGVVLKVLQEYTGIDTEDMHEVLKSKFNPKKVSVGTEDEIEIGASTKGLDTEEFIRYIEKVRIWATEALSTPTNMCYIPLPQEVIKPEYQDLYIESTHRKI